MPHRWEHGIQAYICYDIRYSRDFRSVLVNFLGYANSLD